MTINENKKYYQNVTDQFNVLLARNFSPAFFLVRFSSFRLVLETRRLFETRLILASRSLLQIVSLKFVKYCPILGIEGQKFQYRSITLVAIGFAIPQRMRLYGTVTEIWRLKDNGVTTLIIWGQWKGHVTHRSRDHSTPGGRLPMGGLL